MSCTFVAIQDLFCGILAPYMPDGTGELLNQVLIFMVLGLVIVKFIRKPLLETLEELQTGWIRLSLIPICLLLSFLNVASYPAPLNERLESVPAAVGLCVAIVLYNGTIYTILKQQSSYFPVSYTHLDVYKRQICIFISSPLLSAGIKARQRRVLR